MPLQASRRPTHLLLLGIVLAIAFWLIDSLVDFTVFDVGDWKASLLPHRIELYMRSLVCAMFVLFGLLASRSAQRFLDLARREEELREETESLTRLLGGLVPICAHCKKIRDESQSWQPVEQYIAERSDLRFSHGLCPDCLRSHYGRVLQGPGE